MLFRITYDVATVSAGTGRVTGLAVAAGADVVVESRLAIGQSGGHDCKGSDDSGESVELHGEDMESVDDELRVVSVAECGKAS